MRLDCCNLHTMTAKYFLISKSSFSIFLGCKTFCFIVPLILLLFPFSLSNHFKSPFLHKTYLSWSFTLLFFLWFSFFFLEFPDSSLIVSNSYSSLFTPTFQSITASASHQQIRSYFYILLDISLSTSAANPSFLSYSLNLKNLLLSNFFKFCFCLSEFYSDRILLKPTAVKADYSIREMVSSFSLTHVVSAPACSSPQLQLC